MRESRLPINAPPSESSNRVRRSGAVKTQREVASAIDIDIADLLRRMRTGEREAAAIFVTRYESRIRRRIRGKLNPSMRRLFDSQDIVSTVGRRLDQFVGGGRLEATNFGQLWALVFRMATNAIIDKSRLFRRLQEAEGPDGHLAQEMLARLRRAERVQQSGAGIEIDAALRLLPDEIDQQIFLGWLAGTRFNEIAPAVNLTHDTVRKRWQKIREHLRARLARTGIEE